MKLRVTHDGHVRNDNKSGKNSDHDGRVGKMNHDGRGTWMKKVGGGRCLCQKNAAG